MPNVISDDIRAAQGSSMSFLYSVAVRRPCQNSFTRST